MEEHLEESGDGGHTRERGDGSPRKRPKGGEERKRKEQHRNMGVFPKNL